MEELNARAEGRCELCKSDAGPGAFDVDSGELKADAPGSVLLCETCLPAASSSEPPSGGHWFCLQESVWSEVAAVQVLSYRLLHRLREQTWAADLLEQVYLEEDVLSWAKRGLASEDDTPTTVDSNGTPLAEGDAVTLIKSLNVKGAGFTAKRGTMVKNIRLGNDPTHIEGRVNGMTIMLKTEFLKKA